MFTEEKIQEAKKLIENGIVMLREDVANDEAEGALENKEAYTSGAVALEYIVGLTDMALVLGAITEEEDKEYYNRITEEFDITGEE